MTVKHIAVIPNAKRDADYIYTKKLLSLLSGKANILMPDTAQCFDGVSYASLDEVAVRAELAIVNLYDIHAELFRHINFF